MRQVRYLICFHNEAAFFSSHSQVIGSIECCDKLIACASHQRKFNLSNQFFIKVSCADSWMNHCRLILAQIPVEKNIHGKFNFFKNWISCDWRVLFLLLNLLNHGEGIDLIRSDASRELFAGEYFKFHVSYFVSCMRTHWVFGSCGGPQISIMHKTGMAIKPPQSKPS